MQDISLLAEMKVGDRVRLPDPLVEGSQSVEAVIARRRSWRDYNPEPLSLTEIAQLLWSAQGYTSPHGLRSAPSAGARYPLELYFACAQGFFHYLPQEHTVEKVLSEDVRPALMEASHGQAFLGQAPVTLLFAAVYERTTKRYKDRGLRYVHIDVGHAAQNVHLQAEALGLASVPVGAFIDDEVARAASLPEEEKPVYMVPVGHKA